MTTFTDLTNPKASSSRINGLIKQLEETFQGMMRPMVQRVKEAVLADLSDELAGRQKVAVSGVHGDLANGQPATKRTYHVSPAERKRRQLHGRFIGLFSHASRDHKRVAGGLRRTKGLLDAIAYLEKIRKVAKGNAAAKTKGNAVAKTKAKQPKNA